jgi:hypothetical protein
MATLEALFVNRPTSSPPGARPHQLRRHCKRGEFAASEHRQRPLQSYCRTGQERASPLSMPRPAIMQQIVEPRRGTTNERSARCTSTPTRLVAAAGPAVSGYVFCRNSAPDGTRPSPRGPAAPPGGSCRKSSSAGPRTRCAGFPQVGRAQQRRGRDDDRAELHCRQHRLPQLQVVRRA